MINENNLFHEIFDEAVGIDDQIKRDSFLARRCGNDKTMLKKLSQMFESLKDISSFLEPSFRLSISTLGAGILPETGAEDNPSKPDLHDFDFLKPGEIVDKYLLQKSLGSGGFGDVFLAEQQEPIKRNVAIKLLKHGFNTEQVMIRFDAERQVLAMMDHDGIARIFDAGSTPSGQPFYVMEYVDGNSITDYCSKNELDVRQNIRLMIRVCDAVQYAHEKGILHRDIKPSNIIVTEENGMAFPKLIDFGICKSFDQPILKTDVETLDWQLVGTPKYMSPEHATFGPKDLDVRSDVYALGIVLYELLTGSAPLESCETEEVSLEEIFRMIREDEVVRPSVKVSNNVGANGSVAESKGSFHKQLSPELDMIVLKALEKDRGLRYDSVRHLSQDLSRFLRGEPVDAKASTNLYRLRKFVSRNSLSVLLVSTIILTLISFAGFAVSQLMNARDARISEANQKAVFQELSAVSKELFSSSSPQAGGYNLKVGDLLKGKKEHVQRSFRKNPDLKSMLLQEMGVIFSNLGLYNDSSELLEEAISLFENQGKMGEPPALECLISLAVNHQKTGELDVALELCEELEGRMKDVQEHKEPMLRTKSIHSEILQELGSYDESAAVLENALEIAKDEFGNNHSTTLEILLQVARLKFNQLQFSEALAISLDVREKIKSHDPENRLLDFQALRSMLYTYLHTRQFGTAMQHVSLSEKLALELFSRNSVEYIMLQVLLGPIEAGAGNFENGVERVNDALEIHRWEIPDNVVVKSELLNALAMCYTYSNQWKNAASQFKLALELAEKIPQFGPQSNRALIFRYHVAICYFYAGRYKDCLPFFMENMKQFKDSSSAPAKVATHYELICGANAKLGRIEDVQKWGNEGLQYISSNFDNPNPRVYFSERVINAMLGVVLDGRDDATEVLLGQVRSQVEALRKISEGMADSSIEALNRLEKKLESVAKRTGAESGKSQNELNSN